MHLISQKLVLHMLFLIIMQESKLIRMSLCLEKKLTLHKVIRLIKSFFDKDQNNYYYNKFLAKFSYK